MVQATPNQYILRPKAAESGLLAEWYSLHERSASSSGNCASWFRAICSWLCRCLVMAAGCFGQSVWMTGKCATSGAFAGNTGVLDLARQIRAQEKLDSIPARLKSILCALLWHAVWGRGAPDPLAHGDQLPRQNESNAARRLASTAAMPTSDEILRMACCFEMRVPAACYYSTCTPDVFVLPCTTCATGSTNGRRASTWSPAQARALTRATVGYSDSIRRRGRAEHADDADDVYATVAASGTTRRSDGIGDH